MDKFTKTAMEVKKDFQNKEQANIYDCFIKSSYVYSIGKRIEHQTKVTPKDIYEYFNK